MNSRDFTSEYVFQEFPKWVTLADGSNILVHNADEEAVLQEPASDDDVEALRAEAEALGLKPHHKAGAEKLKQMIAEAKG
ncbi:hypothetical protein [Bordetella hinzii]|uniref:hypothetical protein n=1 Tax=Bordetella hinzii TaxID=103855 RepID=UPI001C0291ED|nr:hypothetical protein [Bordetella hinzii]QWF40052.1 hypothetical protein HHA25_18135 [Bordetella hinzii]QWF44599.1 hypothetical protein HHA24_18130 [Bordetella hinzii]QWF49135.1 hypothetical protein HHA23_18130 [Bordetella hinzii]QWF53671.1 hypothetical protein HHA22_18135 [Bordetella hinzii]QWF58161.1 hypothetical protein HHA21_17890 [Bordetella hinzii]